MTNEIWKIIGILIETILIVTAFLVAMEWVDQSGKMSPEYLLLLAVLTRQTRYHDSRHTGGRR